MLTLASTPQFEAAIDVARTLAEHRHQAFFAGGCVRDLLLSSEPKDFDVATSATPAQIIGIFPRSLQVGAHFGVVVVLSGAVATEVATFRTDGTYLDGRRPDSVQFALDPREDVLRRDFTVNGMLLDPTRIDAKQLPYTAPESAILDFVAGQADLQQKIIRTIGSPARRFAEDKLRMLRAIRFAARLNFSIAPETLAAIQHHAAEIVQVSNERIRDELTRMLTEGHPRRAFELLHTSGLLAHILPEVDRLRGVQQPPQYHPEGDVWIHTLMLLDHLPAGASATLAWGMLLHDIGKPATYQPPDPRKPDDRIRFNGHVEVGMRVAEVLLDRLRFSNDDQAQILALIQHHMRFGDLRAMRTSTLKRFIRLPQFDEHLALHQADCASSHGDLRLHALALEAYLTDEPAPVRPALLLTGHDLIAAGYRPGPHFKSMLEAAEDAQLERSISTLEEALDLVRVRFHLP
jgi:poly(A) polymerase